MLILLPVIVFISILTVIVSHPITKRYLLREKILIAFIVWSVILTASTEILSSFKQFTFLGVLASWSLALGATVYLVSRYPIEQKSLRIHTQIHTLFANRLQSILTIGILGIVSISGLLALFTAPNNWDATYYRLARVMHWIQNQSVDFYPTHITQQLYLAPWASYPIAHFQLLTGGDVFANSVQWVAMIMTLITISLIITYWKGNLRTQLIGIVFAATLPMGILQSSSVQSDYVLGFWMLSFVYFGIKATREKSSLFPILTGISLGLAFYTKSTSLFFAVPFIIWFAYSLWECKKRIFWKKSAIIICAALAISSMFMYRNIRFAGTPVFSMHDYYQNSPLSASSFVSSTIKNLALEYWTPSKRLNTLILQSILWIHDQMGVDINAPGLTLPTTTFRLVPLAANEDFAASPFHVLIICIVGLLIVIRKIRVPEGVIPYFLCAIGGFLCFTFFVRWQPWNARLHLPIFLLCSPVIAIMLSKSAQKQIINIIAVLFLLSSGFYLFFNELKPVISLHGQSVLDQSRERQYFAIAPTLYEKYVQIGEIVEHAGYQKIGLIIQAGDDEYGLWHEFARRGLHPQIEHIEITNPTSILQKTEFHPEMVIITTGDKTMIQKYKGSQIPTLVFEQ